LQQSRLAPPRLRCSAKDRTITRCNRLGRLKRLPADGIVGEINTTNNVEQLRHVLQQQRANNCSNHVAYFDGRACRRPAHHRLQPGLFKRLTNRARSRASARRAPPSTLRETRPIRHPDRSVPGLHRQHRARQQWVISPLTTLNTASRRITRAGPPAGRGEFFFDILTECSGVSLTGCASKAARHTGRTQWRRPWTGPHPGYTNSDSTGQTNGRVIIHVRRRAGPWRTDNSFTRCRFELRRPMSTLFWMDFPRAVGRRRPHVRVPLSRADETGVSARGDLRRSTSSSPLLRAHRPAGAGRCA